MKINNKNLLLLTDSYKISHSAAYHPKLEIMVSYLESRGGKYPRTVFALLQYYIQMIEGVQVTKEKIDEAQTFWEAHFGRKDVFNRQNWEYILNEHSGVLPIKIRAVKEGAIVPVKNVLLTIENTDPKCGWLTNFIETLLLKLWYPCTIATQSLYIKNIINNYLQVSGTPESIGFKCHDFGYRGVSSEEQAAIGAASHLLSFLGTDTVAGIVLLMNTYNADMCGFSIPATEHSIICSFGRENEIEACRNFLKQYPTGLIACVSDTYNIFNACENIWGGVLKDEVMSRDGTLVIRPDSGDYLEIVPKILSILWDKFGGTINDKGFKVLDSHVRVIQGDGMEPETINQLFNVILHHGWSADNLVVGSGGGLLVKDVNRDTNKFAIKACAARIDGEWVDIWKDPITDSGKGSKKGRLKLIKENGEYKTVAFDATGEDLLVNVFENGRILKYYTLDEIKMNMQEDNV